MTVDENKYNELLDRTKHLENELELLRKKEEARSLRQGDALLKAFRTSSVLMTLSKPDTGRFVDVNSKFLEVLEYDSDDILGSTAEDLHIFNDLKKSNKYLRLISRLKKIKDYPVELRTKSGKIRHFLFSAETLFIDDDLFLLSLFDETGGVKDRMIADSPGSVLNEIFETMSSYLALFSAGEDKKFRIIDFNTHAEEVELVDKDEIIGRCVDETSLASRNKLTELLRYVNITGNAHKLAASPTGDESDGYYMGFPLSSGNILVTWEPGSHKLRASENRNGLVFRNIAKAIPEMIFEADRNGRIVFINNTMENYLGYNSVDIATGLYLRDLFTENHTEIIPVLRTTRNNLNPAAGKYIIRSKDGKSLNVLMYSLASFADEKISGYRAILKDVSNQESVESQLAREKALLENLVDFAPEAIAIVDTSGCITAINKEFTNLFGYTTEEAAGNNIGDLVIPAGYEEYELDQISIKEARKTERKDKWGELKHVSLIQYKADNAGSVFIYRDISEERKISVLQEALYNISTAALRKYSINEIYPVIITELGKIWDKVSLCIALYNEKTDSFYIPSGQQDIKTIEWKDAHGTLTGWIIKHNKPVLLSPELVEDLFTAGEIRKKITIFRSGMAVPLRIENRIIGVISFLDYEKHNTFKAEDLVSLEFISNQIAIVLHMGIMLDDLVSERQKAEEAAQSKQIFMSTMSHEIRTPLNEVIGITNLLLQGNPNPDQMDYLKTLKFSGNHLLTLVNDVLDYNKIESGKIVLEMTQFNLVELLDEIVRSYSFRSKAKHLDFNVDISPDIPNEVIGDPVRLNQILSNLLSNALKFTSKGSISVSVKELRRSKGKSELSFSVTDTGIGIPHEKHCVIFESFTQASVDTTRQFGGTGLGLAICKKLIEMQNGKIEVESEPGIGTTFSFSITISIPEKSGKKDTDNYSEDYSGLEGRKILVAEDNKINFFVANKFLTSWGVQVIHAENGQVALDLLKDQDFDLILMDLHMPVLDGIEAIRIIRNSEDKRISTMPIVALTAAVISESLDRIDDLQINDYVLKPFRPHDLFERIYTNIRIKD